MHQFSLNYCYCDYVIMGKSNYKKLKVLNEQNKK